MYIYPFMAATWVRIRLGTPLFYRHIKGLQKCKPFLCLAYSNLYGKVKSAFMFNLNCLLLCVLNVKLFVSST